MADTDTLIFRGWPNPLHDRYEQQPNGLYSRIAWLPSLGPTSWLLWGTVAAPLTIRTEDVIWDRRHLAAALGIDLQSRQNKTLPRTLDRLCQFGLFRHQDGIYLVRTSAPPRRARALEHLPPEAVELHTRIFGITHTRSTGEGER
jgi:hypothetical protein